MAEANGNGEIPLTGDARVDAALVHIRGWFRDLEDAMLVQAHLEKRMAERLKESLLIHDRLETRVAEHERWQKQFEDDLDTLKNMLMRREGGPEAQE